MEPITITATAIITLIFSEALKESGKALGKAASEQVNQLWNLLKKKFQQAGVEGLLTLAENEPTDQNKQMVQTILQNQMQSDEEFASELETLVEQLRSDSIIEQVFFRGVRVHGSAEVGDVEQETNRTGSVRQEAMVDVEVGNDLKIGNIKQKN